MNNGTNTLDAVRDAEQSPAATTPKGPPRAGKDFKPNAQRLQELIEAIDTLPDSDARDMVHDCMRSLVTFYGEGLERILQLTNNAGSDGAKVMDALVHDKLVSSLLLIHDLHPHGLKVRLNEALDKVRPYLKSHGGDVELVSLIGETAHLRLQGTCQSCPSSAATLELAVRQAIEEACPDLAGFEVDGIAPAADSKTNGIPHGSNAPHWTVIDHFEPLPDRNMRALHVEGVSVMVCRLKDNLYAYSNRCAACASPLDSGTLAGDVLCCASGHRFDVHRAGVSLDDSGAHLTPLPLLALNGSIKIAVTVAAK